MSIGYLSGPSLGKGWQRDIKCIEIRKVIDPPPFRKLKRPIGVQGPQGLRIHPKVPRGPKGSSDPRGASWELAKP